MHGNIFDTLGCIVQDLSNHSLTYAKRARDGRRVFLLGLSGSVILGDGLWHTITALDALIRGDAVVVLRNLYANLGSSGARDAARSGFSGFSRVGVSVGTTRTCPSSARTA